MTDENSKRVFFALWPDAGVRAGLQQLQDDLSLSQARRVKVENLHVTLRFIGSQPVNKIDRLIEQAGTIQVPRYSLVLDRTGQFRRAGVVWAGCTQCPPESGQLYGALADRLAVEGFETGQRLFMPHVTLYRKVMKSFRGSGFPAIRWDIGDFVLVESVLSSTGAEYHILEHFGLLSD